MKRVVDVVAQGLLGLIFFVLGLDKFLHFTPPPELPEPAMEFFGALAATGYFLPVLGLVETVSGALLLVRRFTPLALVLLAPVVVQILLFHLFLAPDPGGLVVAVLVVAIEAYLGLVVYRDSFRRVLAPKPAA